MTCTFVPPYLLARLAAAAGDPALTASGQRTLSLDERLRARREVPPRAVAPPAVGDEAAGAEAARVVHDAGNREDLPGAVARRDGDPATGDPAVDEAFDWSALVWDLFANEFARPSVDGRGTPLSVTVHYGQDYDNAFWDGEQLVFGDGDGQVFDRFTKPQDVLAHEFTHGVTQFTAALTYQGQSGALNESVSDVFASMTKQRHLDQTAEEADWLIGEGLFLPGIAARALRSMTEPGTAYDDPQLGRDPQVGSMADYVDTEEDSGGVHINSGIPNRAFALAALALQGHSWERAGRIWYDALTAGEVTARTDFTGFAEATVSSAGRLYPDDTAVVQQVRSAWVTVGVLGGQDPLPLTLAEPAKATTTAPAATATGGPAAVAPAQVAVRRSGGFAGTVRHAQLDLDTDPAGAEVRSLLTAVDLGSLAPGTAGADRFVYTVEFGEHSLTLPEQDLTPELHRVVQLVLGDGRGDLEL